MRQRQIGLRAALLVGAVGLAGCNSNAVGFNLMDRAVTWGDVVTIGAIGVAAAIVGGVAIYLIAAFGKGMSR